MQNYLIKLPRRSKRLLMLVSDAILLPTALWSAISLRLGDWTPNIHGFNWLMLMQAIVRLRLIVGGKEYGVAWLQLWISIPITARIIR